jgi:hypothetical protein
MATNNYFSSCDWPNIFFQDLTFSSSFNFGSLILCHFSSPQGRVFFFFLIYESILYHIISHTRTYQLALKQLLVFFFYFFNKKSQFFYLALSSCTFFFSFMSLLIHSLLDFFFLHTCFSLSKHLLDQTNSDII